MATKKIRVDVRVTQKHIDEGVRRTNSGCPIALALKGKGFIKVSVGPSFMAFTPKGAKIERNWWVSKEVTKFINSFDRNGKRYVKPFRFSFSY